MLGDNNARDNSGARGYLQCSGELWRLGISTVLRIILVLGDINSVSESCGAWGYQ